MNALIKQHLIDPEICIRCGTCEETCPIDAAAIGSSWNSAKISSGGSPTSSMNTLSMSASGTTGAWAWSLVNVSR